MNTFAEFAGPAVALAVLLLVIAGAVGFLMFARRLRKQRELESAMETRMLAELRAIEIAVTNAPPTFPEKAARTNAPDADFLSGPEHAAATTRLWEKVVEQLRRANLLECVEGKFELRGDPEAGAVVLLRDKRRILVLGTFEGESIAQHNLRRFDLVIFVCQDGRGITLAPVESMIADSLSGLMR